MPWEKFGEISYDFEEDVFNQVRLAGRLYKPGFRENEFDPTLEFDSLQRLIMAEEDGMNVFDKNFSLFVDIENLITNNSDDNSDENSDWLIEPTEEDLKPREISVNKEDFEIKKIPAFFVPFSLAKELNIERKLKFLPDSHGKRGRKPILRKHKKRTQRERNFIAEKLREIVEAGA